MKYKVSLLPDINRKRLNGRKKSEKIQMYALVTMLILFVIMLFVIGSSFIAQKKLEKIHNLDEKCKSEVSELQQYREINAALEEKIERINSIQVEEPELSNFVAAIANIKHPGVSITSIECSDWKVTRLCTVSGTCSNRTEYLKFEELLTKLDGVLSVTNSSYISAVGTADGLVQFSVDISCGGGSIAFEPIGPEVSEVQTTIVDELAGVEG